MQRFRYSLRMSPCRFDLGLTSLPATPATPPACCGLLEPTQLLYVRESSAHQVQHNRESQLLQYAMRNLLVLLGWSQVEVVDEDLDA